MTSNDVRGQQVLDACKRVNLAVPEEVAVLGVDNDEILCKLCHPPLSSIAPNAELVGYEAAAMLDRLMAGAPTPKSRSLIEPKGVITRQSTDILAIDDSEVAAVVRFIREQSCRGCSMNEVMRYTRLSRSLLERRFRRSLGHSPQAEIRAIQIKRVKEMLSGSDLSLADIANIAGYRHPEYMSVVFKRETGHTPGEYRKAAQPKEVPSSRVAISVPNRRAWRDEKVCMRRHIGYIND
jgi:LacI family transcriptional regulator